MWAKEVQFLKGAAIISVIALHVSASYTQIQPVNGLAAAGATVDAFVHFAVPLFVFASGVVLALNYSGSFSTIEFYKKRAAVLIPPYLIFTTFYLVYRWLVFGWGSSAWHVLTAYLAGRAYYHLWFIPLIGELYVLYPLLVHALGRHLSRVTGWRVALAAVVLQAVYYAFISWYSPITSNELASYLANRLFVGYLAYFILGMYVGRNLDVFRAWVARLPTLPVAGIVAAVTCAISGIWVMNNGLLVGVSASDPAYLVSIAVLTPILYFCVFLLLFRWSLSAHSHTARRFGDYSLWVYLLHPVFIDLGAKAFAGFGIVYDSWLFYPLVFGTTSLLCLTSTYLLAGVPLNSLVGGPRRPVVESAAQTGKLDQVSASPAPKRHV